MRRSLKKYLYYTTLLFCLSVLMSIYVIQSTSVIGKSMEPTLKEGEKILVNKLLYQWNAPKRFDIIVFRYLYKDNEYYIKRIIGLPGETVQIIDGKVYIDGKELDDPFGSIPIEKAKRADKPITLGEDEYFVLGDNRNYSSDSRESDIGNVKRVQVLGKAFFKLWPPGDITAK